MFKFLSNFRGQEIFNATIPVDSSVSTDVVVIKKPSLAGFLSCSFKTTGGDLKVELYASIDGVDFAIPNGMSDIESSHSAGFGLYPIAPGMAISHYYLQLTASTSDVDAIVRVLVH